MKSKHGPDKHKHLEMIQGVINRLASNSFSIKQWTVMLVSALLVLVAREGSSVPIWVALVPVIAFWGLDGYFLRQERRFRNLYMDVCETDECEITFSMNDERKSKFYWRAAISVTLVSYYGLFIAIVLVIAFLL